MLQSSLIMKQIPFSYKAATQETVVSLSSSIQFNLCSHESLSACQITDITEYELSFKPQRSKL